MQILAVYEHHRALREIQTRPTSADKSLGAIFIIRMWFAIRECAWWLIGGGGDGLRGPLAPVGSTASSTVTSINHSRLSLSDIKLPEISFELARVGDWICLLIGSAKGCHHSEHIVYCWQMDAPLNYSALKRHSP